MKITKLIIKNMYGITEQELDGRSIEISGTNGVGKSSVIDAIRYALENKSHRDCIIKKGATEGEVVIETNSGLHIHRKIRDGKADYKNIKENNKEVFKPEAYLDSIFSPLQLDPIAFTKMSRQDQNRAILDLIEFDWNLDYIKEKFGEIPQGVNYDQHILKVLNDIQSEKGFYFQTRQDINREIRHDEDFCCQIAASLPENYNPKRWEEYDFAKKNQELAQIRHDNSLIDKAKVFQGGYVAKLRGLEIQRDTEIQAETEIVEHKKSSIQSQISNYRHEIELLEEQLNHVDDGLQGKIQVIKSKFDADKATLDKNNAIAIEWMNKEPMDESGLSEEIDYATQMLKHVAESKRLEEMKMKIDDLKKRSEDLTNKIEIARELPAEILKLSKIPVKGLTVVNGEPLIDMGKGSLPVNSLSEGEMLLLCVDIALSKLSNLQILLVDGIERLSTTNRLMLYDKCKSAGLQIIATRTTDSEDMEIVYL